MSIAKLQIVRRSKHAGVVAPGAPRPFLLAASAAGAVAAVAAEALTVDAWRLAARARASCVVRDRGAEAAIVGGADETVARLMCARYEDCLAPLVMAFAALALVAAALFQLLPAPRRRRGIR